MVTSLPQNIRLLNEKIRKARGPTPTHVLNPETGLYDRTPEFKAWWDGLSEDQQRATLD